LILTCIGLGNITKEQVKIGNYVIKEKLTKVNLPLSSIFSFSESGLRSPQASEMYEFGILPFS